MFQNTNFLASLNEWKFLMDNDNCSPEYFFQLINRPYHLFSGFTWSPWRSKAHDDAEHQKMMDYIRDRDN